MHTRIGLDVFRHQRNLNMMVIGGSGTGKSRSVSKPEILQANCSYIILSPKGELLRDCAEFLLHEGYDIKSLLTSKKANAAAVICECVPLSTFRGRLCAACNAAVSCDHAERLAQQ